jgi:zinc-binding alcohol dehydrogenase family protein
MKAVASPGGLPSSDPGALVEVEMADPVPGPRDLLVAVRAVAVNPLETRLRGRPNQEGGLRVLGWDAAGEVVAVGAGVTLFRPGERVFYAGSILRPGANSTLHCVDERLAGPMPVRLGFAETAGLAAGGITASEMLFDKMRLDDGTLLVIGGAGGVGSMAVQLACARSTARVIATAGRAESRAHCLAMGAHDVIDHGGDMVAQLKELGVRRIERIFCTTASDVHWKAMLAIAAPMGAIGLIDEGAALDVRALRPKGLSVHYEAMFARAIFNLPDMIEQHRLLAGIAALVDAGRLRSPLGTHFGAMTPANLLRAHAAVESGGMIGKAVLEVG